MLLRLSNALQNNTLCLSSTAVCRSLNTWQRWKPTLLTFRGPHSLSWENGLHACSVPCRMGEPSHMRFMPETHEEVLSNIKDWVTGSEKVERWFIFTLETKQWLKHYKEPIFSEFFLCVDVEEPNRTLFSRSRIITCMEGLNHHVWKSFSSYKSPCIVPFFNCFTGIVCS